MYTQRRRRTWNQGLDNKTTHQQAHAKIEKTLKTIPHGLTIEELKKKTNVTRRTLYKHLKKLEKNGQVHKEKHRWIWITHWKKAQEIKDLTDIIVRHINKKPTDEDLLSENLVIFAPYTQRSGKKSFACLTLPGKWLDCVPQDFLTILINYYLSLKTKPQEDHILGCLFDCLSEDAMNKLEKIGGLVTVTAEDTTSQEDK